MTDDTKSNKDMHKSGWMVPTPRNYSDEEEIGLRHLFMNFKGRMSFTWILVLAETILLALIPLLIGFVIDDLLSGGVYQLLNLVLVMTALLFVAVIRRIYDTRIYSGIGVYLQARVENRNTGLSISALNARLGMSKELVEFLEQQVPMLLTSFVQVIAAIVILATFHVYLSLAAVVCTLSMIAVYAAVHSRFFRLNGHLNEQTELQVGTLETRKSSEIMKHFLRLRIWEIKISDTEAVLYGIIFAQVIAFMSYILWFGTGLPDATTGSIFSIVNYSWTYVESSAVLPLTLQSLTRLREITYRINHPPPVHEKARGSKEELEQRMSVLLPTKSSDRGIG